MDAMNMTEGEGTQFEAEPENPRPMGILALVFGVLLPLATIMIEAMTHLCADAFFDPLPNWPMTMVVTAVPIINLALWIKLRSEQPITLWWIRLGGAAISVAAVYALVFLPLYALSVLAILLFGLGLLPFAPLFSLITGLRAISRLSHFRSGVWKQAFIGMAAGGGLIVLADLPSSATQFAVSMTNQGAESEARAASIMRWLGSDDELVRLAYGTSGRAGGLASVILLGSWDIDGRWGGSANSMAARRLYFRTTGHGYASAPIPDDLSSTGRAFWNRDQDQGGASVGGKVALLSLASSRIDGSVSAADNLGYGEWTMEFANDAAFDSEARMTLALPEGAVASRATLWIDGEPREASIAGRAETRAAYQAVVQRSRDPLLVTTAGPGRLLVQAFPVPAHGRLKLRIGYSAPLEIAANGSRRLAMPAIIEQNFKIDPTQQHSVWMSGDLMPNQPGWNTARLTNGVVQVRGSVSDAGLRTTHPRLAVPAITAPAKRVAHFAATPRAPALTVSQTIEQIIPDRPSSLMILVDGSVDNQAAAQALAKAVDGIAPGTQVGLTIAADKPVTVAVSPWSADQKQRFVNALNATDFTGGHDNVPALSAMLNTMTGTQNVVLWLHGPQPYDFEATSAPVEQWLERNDGALPRLIRYQQVEGPMFRLEGQPWFEKARIVTPSADPVSDIRQLLGTVTSTAPTWQVTRRQVAGSAASASAHIARLWAGEELAVAPSTKQAERERFVGIANQLNIITPVSGAVVLETKKDYEANGLPVPSGDDVPSVPEPHEWAMMLILLAIAVRVVLPRWRQQRALGQGLMTA